MTSRVLAALLLSIQGPGGGVLALAHSRDPAGAPTVIEAEHSGRCPVVHDAVTCQQCQHGGLLPAGPVARTPARDAVRRPHGAPHAVAAPASRAARRSPPSRAPPQLPV